MQLFTMPTKAVLSSFAKKYGPSIMVTAGVGGLIYSNVLTHKATLKAADILDELHEKQKEEGVKLTKREARWADIKAVYKVYTPAVVLGAVSSCMIFGGFGIVSKKLSIASTTAQIATEGFREYRQKVIERYGEDGDKDIRSSVAQEKAKNADIPKRVNDPMEGVPGKQLFFDSASQRYFYSTREEIRKAEIAVNDRLTFETFVSLNEFYYELDNEDLTPIHSLMGEGYGFDVNKSSRMDIRFDCFMSKYDIPCTVVLYDLYEKPRR